MLCVQSKRLLWIPVAAGVMFAAALTSAQQSPAPNAGSAQAPAGPAGQRGGGRGRGGLPGATPEQTQAVADMNAALGPLTTAVTSARSALVATTFAEVRNAAGVRAAIDKLRTAEFALSTRRADEFAKLQSGSNRLSAEQVNALAPPAANLAAAQGGRAVAGPSALPLAPSFRGPRSGPAPALNATPRGGMNVGIFPGITERQLFFYQQALNVDFQWDPLESTCRHASLSIL